MKILCICPIGIGNYILCYPAFALLKKLAPETSMHLLALREGIGQMARNDALWDGITVFDPTKMRKNIPEALRIIHSLRVARFDSSLNYFPTNTWHYHLLPWLAGIRRRYAFHYDVSGLSKLSFLVNCPTPVNVELHDIRQNYRLITNYLGKDIGEQPPVFPVLFSESDARRAKLHMASLSSNTIRIGIHPGSSADHGMDAKRWSPEKFAGLADKVCRFCKGEAFIFGGADEASLKIRVAQAMKLKAHIVSPASLAQTAALLDQCAMCLCNDSGLMHLAACMGVATVGIFGPTDEKRNGPYGSKTLVIRKTMEGFPLWNARNVGKRSLPGGIDPQASLKALTVEEAWAQLQPWIIGTIGVGQGLG
jgi:heptosyltransferase II